jgi:hypothetical protein
MRIKTINLPLKCNKPHQEWRTEGVDNLRFNRDTVIIPLDNLYLALNKPHKAPTFLSWSSWIKVNRELNFSEMRSTVSTTINCLGHLA